MLNEEPQDQTKQKQYFINIITGQTDLALDLRGDIEEKNRNNTHPMLVSPLSLLCNLYPLRPPPANHLQNTILK